MIGSSLTLAVLLLAKRAKESQFVSAAVKSKQ